MFVGKIDLLLFMGHGKCKRDFFCFVLQVHGRLFVCILASQLAVTEGNKTTEN